MLWKIKLKEWIIGNSFLYKNIYLSSKMVNSKGSADITMFRLKEFSVFFVLNFYFLDVSFSEASNWTFDIKHAQKSSALKQKWNESMSFYFIHLVSQSVCYKMRDITFEFILKSYLLKYSKCNKLKPNNRSLYYLNELIFISKIYTCCLEEN